MSFILGPEGWRGSGHKGIGVKPCERRGMHEQRAPVVPFHTNGHGLEKKTLLSGPLCDVFKCWLA